MAEFFLVVPLVVLLERLGTELVDQSEGKPGETALNKKILE